MSHKNFKIYKPYGYLSQFINNQSTRKNKKLLGELFNFPQNIMAIGRLDEDSEGLLFLTTDGRTSELVRSRSIEKEYFAQLDGVITSLAIESLIKGVNIGINGKVYQTLPCTVIRLQNAPTLPERNKKIRDDRHGPTSWISITLTEGKFRQVKKMTASVGFPTLRLIRVRIGNEHLGQLLPGEIKELENFDI